MLLQPCDLLEINQRPLTPLVTSNTISDGYYILLTASELYVTFLKWRHPFRRIFNLFLSPIMSSSSETESDSPPSQHGPSPDLHRANNIQNLWQDSGNIELSFPKILQSIEYLQDADAMTLIEVDFYTLSIRDNDKLYSGRFVLCESSNRGGYVASPFSQCIPYI